MRIFPRALGKSGLRLLQGLGVLCMAGPAMAGIDIAGISGIPTHGSALIISGSGFGTKSQGAPLLWDDFETGNVGNEVAGNNGWRNYRPTAPGNRSPYYADGTAYGQGGKAVRKDLASGEDFRGLYWDGFDGDREAYVTLYMWWNTANNSSPSDSIMKWIRLNTNSVYDGVPLFGQTYRPASNWLPEYYNSGNSSLRIWNQFNAANRPSRGQWHRMDMYWKLDSQSGAAQTWMDLKPNLGQINVATQQPGEYHTIYSLLLPLMASSSQEPFTMYVDNVYVDNTRARVEVGNAPTWSECTKREVQIPSKWSDSSITIEVNQGSFDDLEEAYLYVVEANGAVNQQGYPLVGIAPPTPPGNLQIN